MQDCAQITCRSSTGTCLQPSRHACANTYSRPSTGRDHRSHSERLPTGCPGYNTLFGYPMAGSATCCGAGTPSATTSTGQGPLWTCAVAPGTNVSTLLLALWSSRLELLSKSWWRRVLRRVASWLLQCGRSRAPGGCPAKQTPPGYSRCIVSIKNRPYFAAPAVVSQVAQLFLHTLVAGRLVLRGQQGHA